MKKRSLIYFFLIFIASLACFAGLLSSSPGGSIDFLVLTLGQRFTQNGKVETILVGYVDFDALSPKVKDKMASAGYKPGDLIPARCILAGEGKKGEIYILKQKEANSESQDPQDWMRIGSYRPVLYDSFESWAKRKKD